MSPGPSALMMHKTRYSRETWSRVAAIAARLTINVNCVVRGLVEYALDASDKPSAEEDGLFALDARIIDATAKAGRKRSRFIENPIVGELLLAVKAFDVEASDATGEQWRRFGQGLRAFAVRAERQSHRIDDAREAAQRACAEERRAGDSL